MDARPLHPDPSVAALPGRPQQAYRTPAGTASSPHRVGTAAPQIIVDYQAARNIAAQVARQREELLKTVPGMDRASEEQR